MIEPLESRELFSATLAATDAGQTAGGTAVATESLVIVHEGFERRGATSVSEVVVTKLSDASSPKLFR